jgi:hypothetical protein
MLRASMSRATLAPRSWRTVSVDGRAQKWSMSAARDERDAHTVSRGLLPFFPSYVPGVTFLGRDGANGAQQGLELVRLYRRLDDVIEYEELCGRRVLARACSQGESGRRIGGLAMPAEICTHHGDP